MLALAVDDPGAGSVVDGALTPYVNVIDYQGGEQKAKWYSDSYLRLFEQVLLSNSISWQGIQITPDAGWVIAVQQGSFSWGSR